MYSSSSVRCISAQEAGSVNQRISIDNGISVGRISAHCTGGWIINSTAPSTQLPSPGVWKESCLYLIWWDIYGASTIYFPNIIQFFIRFYHLVLNTHKRKCQVENWTFLNFCLSDCFNFRLENCLSNIELNI